MLHVITGPMYASKSTALIAQARRHRLANRAVLCIKHSSDTRYEAEKIASHDGETSDGNTVCMSDINISFWQKSLVYDVLCVDEGQFFGDDLLSLIEMFLMQGEDKKVYVSGLDMDVHGNPFRTMMKLMAVADQVEKRKAVCVKCGQDAMFTTLKADHAPTKDVHVQVGGLETYQPVCRKCFA